MNSEQGSGFLVLVICAALAGYAIQLPEPQPKPECTVTQWYELTDGEFFYVRKQTCYEA